MKIFAPTIMGPGAIIKEVPSDPEHAVRMKELHEYATMQVVTFEDALELTIPKRPYHSIIQVFDSNSHQVVPNSLSQEPDGEIVQIDFLEPQSGYVLIFTVGS